MASVIAISEGQWLLRWKKETVDVGEVVGPRSFIVKRRILQARLTGIVGERGHAGARRGFALFLMGGQRLRHVLRLMVDIIILCSADLIGEGSIVGILSRKSL